MLHHTAATVFNQIFPAFRSASEQAVVRTDSAPAEIPFRTTTAVNRTLLRCGLTLAVLLALAGTANAGSLYLAKLSGANENPPTSSTATGLGVLILNDAETQATITATHNISIPVTGGHIHRGAANVNGPVIFPFPAPTSPVGPLTWAIPAADVANLKALGLYMNFHTAVNPGGAIRAQLTRAWLAPAAMTMRQTRVANALDVSAGFDADLDQVLIQTNLAAADSQAQTLDELSARTVYSPARQEIEGMTSLTDTLFAYADDARLNPGPAAARFSVLVRGGRDFGTRSNSDNQIGSRISRPWAVAGVDYRLSEASRGGLAAGYASGKDTFNAGAGATTTKTTALQAYFSTKLGDSGAALDGAVGYGWAKVDSTRNLPSLGRMATASPDGTVWSAALKASKAITLHNQATIVPYALIDTQEAKIDAYNEGGAGAAGLMVPKQATRNSALEGGASLMQPIKVESGTLTARLQAGWNYLFENGAGTLSTRLIGSPVAFDTPIDGPGKSSAHIEASLTATTASGLLATLGYRGMLGGNGRTTHTIEARIVFRM